MGLPIDTVKAILKDKNGPYISWSDIRDDMGKTSDDRHLTLFALAVCRLIMFLKALGYVSVELADFLFQIEKGANPAQESYLKPSFHSISSEGKETGICQDTHSFCSYE
ncbi:hypothetical protein Golob_027510 [Gossypium lobatum]|uniref:Uncharacterized protein n=1 Tax=Gossypium lobatum TaxID=34289 RepID=A0A7J8NI13_9ROSI|nr:hypothetical protein [Gossypium lobatum]